MTFTVCPLSNVRLRVVDAIGDHPIARMLQLGLRATVNSDDPAYFGGYIADNYRAVAALLSRDELTVLARNSFLGSFLPLAEITHHVLAVDAFAADASKED